MLNIKTFNNSSIKLQGIPYYADCYNFWDLNLCSESFSSNAYDELIHRVSTGSQRPWNEDLMVIDFDNYNKEYSQYQSLLSKNVRRDIDQSEKKGFIFKEYDFNSFVHDFSEINYSQNTFKGSINPWYLNHIDFFEGSHSEGQHLWEDEKHYSKWYGIFKYLKHYKQGDVTTDEKLYAYCKVLVDGEMACIGQIFGHAKYLKQGLMFKLITSIVKDIINNKNIRCLIYSGAGQYPTWKNRMLFEKMKINVQF
tara:strand:+ start:7638 stop:8393 length:756 start_codon:yes stop_codon:yes gene_type:complete